MGLFKAPTAARRFSVTAWLAKHKGGQWEYDGQTTWWCDDEKRHLSRVALDANDDSGNSPVGYMLYGEPPFPKQIYFTENGS